MALQRIRNEEEARIVNDKFLHCGSVTVGDAWATDVAWSDPRVRKLARQLLARYRRSGELPSETEYRQLATCCAN